MWRFDTSKLLDAEKTENKQNVLIATKEALSCEHDVVGLTNGVTKGGHAEDM